MMLIPYYYKTNYYSMFEEKMEKGLFTFYWEENHKSKQPTKRGEVQSSLGAEATK